MLIIRLPQKKKKLADQFSSQISDPFPAWVVKDGFAEDTKIKFIWGELGNFPNILVSHVHG